jgi:ssDNA-binding Zn-finger/Zn-ribbon topoisomerase 1
MGAGIKSREKTTYKVAICPVCKKGKLHVPWGAGLFEKDDVGFIYLPISMDEFHEAPVVTWCPECNATLRIRCRYISIEHWLDDGTIDIYHNWKLKEGTE